MNDTNNTDHTDMPVAELDEQHDDDTVGTPTTRPRRRWFPVGRAAVIAAAVIGLGVGVGGYALGDALIGNDHDGRHDGRHDQVMEQVDGMPGRPGMHDRGGMGDRDGDGPHGPMGNGQAPGATAPNP